jgi:Calcineurin-like phosphoesterase
VSALSILVGKRHDPSCLATGSSAGLCHPGQFRKVPGKYLRSGPRCILLVLLACSLLPGVSSLPVNNTVTYSFIHISDPQSLTTNYPETLDLTFAHIQSLKNTYNITAVIVTGDLVNTWDDTKDWNAYAHARNLTTIPVYEIAGNHDSDGGDHLEYYTAYTKKPAENYVTSIEDFDLVGINYARTTLNTGELSRLREALTGSPRPHAIIATHYYMDEGGTLSPLGNDIDTYLIVKPTLALMGHMHANFVRVRMVGGFPTIAEMTNYQDGVPGGTTGWNYSAGTLYTVTQDDGKVRTITARIVHIYPVPYVEDEVPVFGDDSTETPELSGSDLSVPSSTHASCRTSNLFCSLNEFSRQGWTDFWHIFS